MESWVDRVIQKWKSEGVKVNEGASIELIAETEKKLNFIFPEDFKAFYRQIDGFKDLDWQEHMFYFWPLHRIVEEYEAGIGFISFCDFLLASHYLGYKKNEQGIFKKYSICDHTEKEPIAQSFEEVVGMINSSNDLIY